MIENNGWNQLIGHEWAVDMLCGALQNERIGHAYLFTGPEHVGKTTLARLFAEALNCEAPDAGARPCSRCRACQLIAADRHPDVRLLEPQITGRGKRTLKIDDVRDLLRDLSLAAYEARYKVALLTHFDAATAGAANAFLKTLEEPPKNVVLLLTAAEADTLLPTITSRCRLMALRPLPTTEIRAALRERWHAPPELADKLAHLADGRPGWAFRALQDPALVDGREAHIGYLAELLPAGRVSRFELADRLARDAEALPELLHTWLSWWRDAALLAWGGSQAMALVNIDHLDAMRAATARWERESLVTALKKTHDAVWQLEHNANARLVMENLLLGYPQVEPPLEQG